MKKRLKITELSTLLKSVQFPHYQRYRFQILIAQTEDLQEDRLNISRLYLLCFPRNKPSKSVTFGPENIAFLLYLPSIFVSCYHRTTCATLRQSFGLAPPISHTLRAGKAQLFQPLVTMLYMIFDHVHVSMYIFRSLVHDVA